MMQKDFIIEFTNVDGVSFKISDKEEIEREMSLDEFFDMLLKEIKNYKIINLNYNVIDNMFTFDIIEEGSLYHGVIDVSKLNNERFEKLLSMLEYEENLRREKLFNDEVNNKKDKLLKQAQMRDMLSKDINKLNLVELEENLRLKKC